MVELLGHLQFFFLSDLLSRRVFSADKRVLGKVLDFQVDLDRPFPEVMRVIFRTSWSRKLWCIGWEHVAEIAIDGIFLSADAVPVGPPENGSAGFILLKDFLLDKQIVDVHGAKLERVNDLQFLRSDEKLLLTQVDVGMRGLLRRLGFEKAVVSFSEWFFDYTPKEKFISWQYVQALSDPDRLKLEIPQGRLLELHPADLADIIEDMDVHERAAMVESLDDEVLADVMEEMDPKVQVSIMKRLEPDKAADILEEMSPDEAADLIADLPSETVQNIFEEMDDDYQEQVKGLLAHEEDEAGGLMTTEFMSLQGDKTIVDALAYIRKNADHVDVIYYLYVVDDESKLLGVVNLRELLSNEIFTPLERIMTSRLITVDVDDEAEHLADLFAKYGFRAIPVVDSDGKIQGVIRFKALLEIVAPHLGK